MLRHPLYLGNFFMWLGVAMATGNGWFICAFIFLYVIYYERIMFAEEQYLRKKYGEAYIQWAVKVPAIIPDFFHYKKNKLCFSGKKVFKQEKTGFLLLFLVFSFFSIIKNTLELKKFTVGQSFYFYGFLFSLFGYLILKYLQKKTKVLDEAIR